jgi:hypothetical protein
VKDIFAIVTTLVLASILFALPAIAQKAKKPAAAPKSIRIDISKDKDPARRMIERQASARLHASRTGFRQGRAVVENRQRQLFRRVHGYASSEIERDD